MTGTARFFQRVLALAFLLLSFLILEAALIGVLPVIGAIALLPAALLLTGRLFTLSLRPAKRHARQAAYPAPRGGARVVRRSLRVYRAPQVENHPTHAA